MSNLEEEKRIKKLLYQRNWFAKNKEKARLYRNAYRAEHLEQTRLLRQKYKKNNPSAYAKYQAIYKAVFVAIKKGELIKPIKCEFCKKKSTIQAHHDDYSKPFDVKWLCVRCHNELHRIARKGL